MVFSLEVKTKAHYRVGTRLSMAAFHGALVAELAKAGFVITDGLDDYNSESSNVTARQSREYRSDKTSNIPNIVSELSNISVERPHKLFRAISLITDSDVVPKNSDGGKGVFFRWGYLSQKSYAPEKDGRVWSELKVVMTEDPVLESYKNATAFLQERLSGFLMMADWHNKLRQAEAALRANDLTAVARKLTYLQKVGSRQFELSPFSNVYPLISE